MGRRLAAITISLAVLTALHPVPAYAGVPAGRLVMTAGGGESIVVVDVGTRTRRTLVSVPPRTLGLTVEQVGDPTWSPRGDRVAYAQSSYLVEPLEGSVRIVDLSTRRVRTVLSLPTVSIEHTAWSPRGDRIAFVVGTGYPPVWGASVNHRQVHVIGVDGRGHRVIGPGVEPQWSPTGRSLAYVGPGGVTVADLDPLVSLPRVVTPATDSPGYLPMYPRWSPDGRRIAFLQSPGLFMEPELRVTDLRDGVTRRLRVGTWSPPSWAPDSLWLAVDDRGIVKVRSTDGRRSQLTFAERHDHSYPAWSSDGSVIAFIKWSDTPQIMLADAKTAATTRVASVPGALPTMQWYPSR